MMIIPNHLIKLDYDPVTDILVVEWPNINGYALSEIEQTLQVIIDTVNHYDVKNLLIDAKKAVVTIGQAEYEKLVLQFGKKLVATRLQKVARLESHNTTREIQVKEISKKVRQPSSIEFNTFSTVADAIHWLKPKIKTSLV